MFIFATKYSKIMIIEELKHTSELTVSEEMTASAMGSGDMKVLAPDFGTFFCHRIAGIDNQYFNFFLWVNLGESRAI